MLISTNRKSFFLKTSVCLSITFFSFRINAQDQKRIDSLKFVIANSINDTVKLKALVILNEINQNRKELVAGYNQQIALSKSLKNYEPACIGYTQLGYYEYANNNFIAAENIFKEGMELAKQTGNYFFMGRFSNSLMGIYDKKGDMETAIKYLKQGEQLLIKVNKKVNLTRLYCNAFTMYKGHNLMLKALDYARKAYTVAQSTGDLEPLGTASWFLANALQIIGKYDSAVYYFSHGLQIAQKLGAEYTQGDMLLGLSGVYADLKNYNTARNYLSQAVAKYSLVNITDRVVECEETLAYLNFMDKDFKKIKDYIFLRKDKVSEDSLNNNRYVYKWLANLALIDNDVDSWKKYFHEYEQAEAVFTDGKIQKNILELEEKYNLSKKESQLLQKETENRKKLWVIAALSLGLFSIILIAVAQNINSKNRQKIAIQKAIIEKQNALAEERLRIAADMHDDVGAGLSRIRYISSSMRSKQMREDDINKIVSLSDEAVEKMNEIIWSLNQGNQQLEELIYYTRSQCSEMVNNAGLAFIFELPENIPAKTIGWKACRNVYLLVKEAVNNAIKHADASSVIIETNIAEQLSISIADNGKGFDPGAIKESGNGLLNYKKRIENLKGSYQLFTSPGNGTKVIFTIPVNAVS